MHTEKSVLLIAASVGVVLHRYIVLKPSMVRTRSPDKADERCRPAHNIGFLQPKLPWVKTYHSTLELGQSLGISSRRLPSVKICFQG